VQCGYRTLGVTSTVLVDATTSSRGEKRLDYECEHCGFSDSEIRTIPRVSERDSGYANLINELTLVKVRCHLTGSSKTDNVLPSFNWVLVGVCLNTFDSQNVS